MSTSRKSDSRRRSTTRRQRFWSQPKPCTNKIVGPLPTTVMLCLAQTSTTRAYVSPRSPKKGRSTRPFSGVCVVSGLLGLAQHKRGGDGARKDGDSSPQHQREGKRHAGV